MLPFIIIKLVSTLLTILIVAGKEEFPEFKYIGCYSTFYAQNRDLGLVFRPFSWESCVLLCQSKGARYAGLVKRKRSCYCGSYLVENSRLFLPTDCPDVCSGRRRRSCGGKSKMTVYQLKEDDSPRILVATNTAINYVKNNTLEPLITLSSGTITDRIRYHYKYNEIYFGIANDIVRSQYSTVTNKYKDANKVLVSAGPLFALDWVGDKIYYLKTGKVIWEASLQGSNPKIVHTQKDTIKNIEIDPYEKKLFYSVGTSLNELNLLNKKETSLVKSSISSVFPILLDVHTQAIYGLSQNKKAIVIKEPGKTEKVLVDLQVVIKNSILDVMVVDDTKIIFTHIDSKALFIQHSFNVVEKIPLKSDVYKDALAVHEKFQAPTKKVACHRVRCSHECQYSPQSTARCVCDSDMRLDTTGRHCRAVRRPRDSSEESDCSSSDCSQRSSSEDSDKDSYEKKEDDSTSFSEKYNDKSSDYS